MIHQEEFTIRAYELDAKGKASVPTICNYLQEIAGNHATKLGVAVDQLLKKNMTWVLSRLHVQFADFPHWRDIIEIQTWPSGRSGKFGTRDFLMLNQEKTIIVRATSSWMILDLKALRPITLPDFIKDIAIPDQERAISDDFPRLPLPENPTIKKQFDVRLNDLDINQHVNNVKYIEWTLESIPLEIWNSHLIKSLEISFRAETRYGEGILVFTEQIEKTFLHRIVSEKDGRDLAILRTNWQNK